jgi:WD40 repeat protein
MRAHQDLYSDVRGVIQWEPVDATEVCSNLYCHLKDRYVYHSSMFAKSSKRNCRCSEWSPSIGFIHSGNNIINNKTDECCIAVCTTDYLIKIFKKPERSYERKWIEIFDLGSYLRAASFHFLKYEKANRAIVPDGKRRKIEFNIPVIELVEDREQEKDKLSNENILKDAKNLIKYFIERLLEQFMQFSNFLEPEELKKKKRVYTDKELKFLDERMNELSKERQKEFEALNRTEEDVKEELLRRLKLRTREIANKKKRGEPLGVKEGKCLSEDTTRQQKKETKDNATSSNLPCEPSTSNSSQSELPTVISSGTKLQERKRVFKSISKEPMYINTHEEYVHKESTADVLCMAWSGPISDYELYLVCGNKTGHIIVLRYSSKNDPDKLFSIVNYFWAHDSFVTALHFLETNNNYCILVSGSNDGSIRLWKIPVKSGEPNENEYTSVAIDIERIELPNILDTFLDVDDIPVNIITTEKSKDNVYLFVAKACYCCIIKLDMSYQFMWKQFFEAHPSIITGIAPFFSYFNRDQPPLLLMYSSSYDGSLYLWKINEIDGSYEKATIIAQDTIHPIWGCSMSPNRTNVAIIREHPPLIARRADLDHKHKCKLFVLPVFEHIKSFVRSTADFLVNYFLATFVQVPLGEPYRKLNLMDLSDSMLNSLSPEQILYIISETPTQKTYRQLSYFIILQLARKYERMLLEAKSAGNINEKLHNEQAIILQKKEKLMNRLLYRLIRKKLKSVNVSSPTNEDDITSILCICDWILLYLSSLAIEKSSDHNTKDAVSDLKELNTIYSTDTCSKSLLPYVGKLLSFYEKSKPLDFSITDIENNIPCRDNCPLCLAPQKIQLQNVLATVCHSCSKCQVARDVFTLAILSDLNVASCRGCHTKTRVNGQQAECPLCANLFIPRT